MDNQMKEKILIVESGAKTRSMLTDILISEYYDVIQAKDAKECLKAIKKNELNLVLLNLNLPDMSGITTLKKIIVDKP